MSEKTGNSIKINKITKKMSVKVVFLRKLCRFLSFGLNGSTKPFRPKEYAEKLNK